MAIRIELETDRVAIRGELTIDSVPTLEAVLFEFMGAARSAVQIDLSRVSALDMAGLQSLLIAWRIAAQTGIPCELLRPSEAVSAALERCGLREMLRTRETIASDESALATA